MAATKLVGADRQRGTRSVHCRLRQPPGLAEPFAQLYDPRKGIEHGERPIVGTSDQQPAIIGAKVDRAIGMTCRTLEGVRIPCAGGRGGGGGELRHDVATNLFLHRETYSRLTCPRFTPYYPPLATGERGATALTGRIPLPYLRGAGIALSSNGKTTDSDSVNRGSNPRGASSRNAPVGLREA